jgi:hypothetical protein
LGRAGRRRARPHSVRPLFLGLLVRRFGEGLIDRGRRSSTVGNTLLRFLEDRLRLGLGSVAGSFLGRSAVGAAGTLYPLLRGMGWMEGPLFHNRHFRACGKD